MDAVLGPMAGHHKKSLATLEMVSVERVPPSVPDCMPGRPLKYHANIAQAFLAMIVFDNSTTTALVERVRSDPTLRRLCGWKWLCDVSSVATFSRVFREIAEADLPGRMHAVLIDEEYTNLLVGHI